MQKNMAIYKIHLTFTFQYDTILSSFRAFYNLTYINLYVKLKADVAELADALVSGSSEAIHVGSSPVVRTNMSVS